MAELWSDFWWVAVLAILLIGNVSWQRDAKEKDDV